MTTMSPVATKSVFTKFAESTDDESANKFNVRNNRGQLVTNGYLRRYIQCWCRSGMGYTTNRAANFDYFMSEEFLSMHVGETASAIGKAASLDARWGTINRETKETRSATRKASRVAGNTITPEILALVSKKYELVNGVWQERPVELVTDELATDLQQVDAAIAEEASALTEASRAGFIEEVADVRQEIVDETSGTPIDEQVETESEPVIDEPVADEPKAEKPARRSEK